MVFLRRYCILLKRCLSADLLHQVFVDKPRFLEYLFLQRRIRAFRTKHASFLFHRSETSRYTLPKL